MAEVNLDVAMQSTSEEILEKLEQGVTASAVKKVQSGIIPSWTTKLTECEEMYLHSNYRYAYYIDVAIEEVSDISKCHVEVQWYDYAGNGSRFGVLTSTTNLRLYLSAALSMEDEYGVNVGYRWEVTEYC